MDTREADSPRWPRYKYTILGTMLLGIILLLLAVIIPQISLVVNTALCQAGRIVTSIWGVTYTRLEAVCANGSGPINFPISDQLVNASKIVFSPDGKRIAFVSLSTQDYQDHISVMRSDGSKLIRLSNAYIYETDPAWSPDGKWFAFRAYLVGAPNSGIYITSTACVENGIDCASTAALLVSGGQAPTWSPDNNKIAFEYPTDDLKSAIYVINKDGSNRLNLTGNESYNANPAWSPKGELIAFYSSRQPAGIYAMHADGSNPIFLTNGYGPIWSADGQYLIFTSERDSDGKKIGIADAQTRVTELYLITPDGQDTIRLTHHNNETINAFAWSP